jgi:hypothetical protein
VRRIAQFFEWGWDISDRLAFTEVIASGRPLDAKMEAAYAAFDFDPAQTVTLEDFFQDYFSRILQKLKELDYDKSKEKKGKRRSPFKSAQNTSKTP